MGTDDRILAVDLGTSGVKVAVTGVRGELVASAVERYPGAAPSGRGRCPSTTGGGR